MGPITDNNSALLSSATTTQEPTFGMRLVGYQFNPSGDPKVNRAKQLCAELADLIENDAKDKYNDNSMYSTLYKHTIGEILNAQMNCVKILTLKY